MKKALSILMALSMLSAFAFCFATTASAYDFEKPASLIDGSILSALTASSVDLEEPAVWIDGSRFTTSFTDKSCSGGGSFSLNTSTSPWTLTLNKVNIDRNTDIPLSDVCGGILASCDLNIVLKGNNTINCANTSEKEMTAAIVAKDLQISGNGNLSTVCSGDSYAVIGIGYEERLTISESVGDINIAFSGNSNNEVTFVAFYSETGNNFTINGGNINVNVKGDNGLEIIGFLGLDFIMNGGNITFDISVGSQSEAFGFFFDNSMLLNGGSIKTSLEVGNDSYSIVTYAKLITINGGSFESKVSGKGFCFGIYADTMSINGGAVVTNNSGVVNIPDSVDEDLIVCVGILADTLNINGGSLIAQGTNFAVGKTINIADGAKIITASKSIDGSNPIEFKNSDYETYKYFKVDYNKETTNVFIRVFNAIRNFFIKIFNFFKGLFNN